MDINQKNQILAKYITSPAGRQRIAASMTQPLRTKRDYQSVARKAFYVEQLPDGALPIYDKDASVVGYMVGDEGQNIIAVQKPKRMLFDLFVIAANPEIPLEEIKAKRFDLLERSIDLGKSAIMAEEDVKAFAVLDAVGVDPINPNTTITVTGNLTANALADAFSNIERNDIRVANVFMNAKDFSDLRKWDRDTLDPVTQSTLLKSGIMNTIWGANIVTSRVVEQGSVYVCGEPEFLGRIPVRTDLTILSADDPKNRMVGFSMFEQIAVGCHNPLAFQKLTITRV
jgi:HK97 family phage major capsid protein